MTEMTDKSLTDEHGPVDVPDPSLIMQVGMGFWPSKTLLTAVELGLFTALGTGAGTADELAETLDLRSRAVADFLDGLVALRLLERDGSGAAASYRNTTATAAFLDATSPRYIGGSWRCATPGCTASGGT